MKFHAAMSLLAWLQGSALRMQLYQGCYSDVPAKSKSRSGFRSWLIQINRRQAIRLRDPIFEGSVRSAGNVYLLLNLVSVTEW